jgi:large subunit ribosomal protein L3
MTIGIVGRKRGMTRVFSEEGHSVPVTVVEVTPNHVASLKTPEINGYTAVQISWGIKKISASTKSEAGNYAKANIETGEGLLEYRVSNDELQQYTAGAEIKVDMFEVGQKVDVTGTTNGKGFAGVIKRHNFSHQRNTHGNSLSHRAPGSIGQCQTPGRVFKGKKMAGHLGNVQRTTQNLEIVRVDNIRNLLLIKGSVPSVKGGKVVIKPSVKTRKKNIKG